MLPSSFVSSWKKHLATNKLLYIAFVDLKNFDHVVSEWMATVARNLVLRLVSIRVPSSANFSSLYFLRPFHMSFALTRLGKCCMLMTFFLSFIIYSTLLSLFISRTLRGSGKRLPHSINHPSSVTRDIYYRSSFIFIIWSGYEWRFREIVCVCGMGVSVM